MSLILVWGTIQPYFISFFRSFDSDLTMAKASMMVPCAAFAMGVFNLFAMKIANKLGVKLTATLAITFYSICLTLMGKILIFFFAFLFVTVAGAGYGICMVTTFYAGWTYYPESKGMVASVMLSSHGFLGVLFNYIILFIMNPNNKKATIKVMEGKQEQDYFDSEIYNRTPHMLLILGSGSLIFGLLGAFMITINPNKKSEDKKR